MKNLIKKIGQNRFQFFFFVAIASLLVIALVVSTTMDKTTDNKGPNINVNEPLPGDDVQTITPEEKFKLPFDENMTYKVVRKFFDKNATKEERLKALLVQGDIYRTSSGTGFAKESDTTFDCLCSLSGKVVSIKENPMYGKVVVIESEEGIKTSYYGLSEVVVSLETEVTQGTKIGSSGFMNVDKSAGNHVFLEVSKDGKYINVESIIGKKISEI